MIAAAFLAIGQCKICRVVLLVGAAALALWLYIGHARREAAAEARAEAIAEMQAATDAESRRRQAVLEQAQAAAQQSAARLAATETKNAKLLSTIARLSAARDSAPCLDAGGTARLRALGADRSEARR